MMKRTYNSLSNREMMILDALRYDNEFGYRVYQTTHTIETPVDIARDIAPKLFGPAVMHENVHWHVIAWLLTNEAPRLRFFPRLALKCYPVVHICDVVLRCTARGIARVYKFIASKMKLPSVKVNIQVQKHP